MFHIFTFKKKKKEHVTRVTIEKCPLSVLIKLGICIKWVTIRVKMRSLHQDKVNTTVCKKRVSIKRGFTAG